MFGDSRDNISRGDKISCVCTDCGERYTHIEKVTQDPPRSTSLCPECYKLKEQVRGAMVAGTWRIRDDERREMFKSLIEQNTPFEVYEKDRVGDLYVYDPSEADKEIDT